MFTSKHAKRSILAAACTLMFASAAFAAETGAGDKGANNMNSGANNTKSTDTRMGAGGSMSSDVRAAAKSTYNDSMMKCKDMMGAERTSCRKDAKMTRDQAYKDAKMASKPMSSSGMSSSSMTNSGSMSSAPGAVPPGGMSEQKNAGSKP
jgi:hypothetical protein